MVEVGIADGDYPEDGPRGNPVGQQAVPELLALGVVQKVGAQLVALAGHQCRGDRVDLLGQRRLQRGHVGRRDIVAHHVHLDADEGDGAQAVAHEGVLGLVGAGDGGR